jgi:SAM-dependent methyltransferase
VATPNTLKILKTFRRPLCLALALFCLASLVVIWWFPKTVDPAIPVASPGANEDFYKVAYQENTGSSKEEEENSDYVRAAEAAAESQAVKGQGRRFVDRYHLSTGKVLDVGAGRGYLQDMVEDYTGLDISPTARRFFHKKFVLASATQMPFHDGEFNAAWSIWVLEHVPHPEHALLEMRRVVKDGGYILMYPAWNCGEWLADGYLVRPYKDLGFGGKVYKASIFPQLVSLNYAIPLIRLVSWSTQEFSGRPTNFQYRLLKPNYQKYWNPDSDALNSLDYFEMALWFESRGDECLNCPPRSSRLFKFGEPLILKVHKPTSQARR